MPPGSLLDGRSLAALAAVLGVLVTMALPRAGAWPLRLLTLLVAVLLAASVVGVWTREAASPRQPRLRLVASGAVPVALRRELELAHGARLDLVEASPDRGELAVALAAVGGEGGEGDAPTRRGLLWVAPIEGTGAPAAAVPDVTALTALAPLGFEPEGVVVRALGEARAGRPLILELAGLPAGWSGTLRVLDPAGAEAASATFVRGPAAGDAARACARVEFVPAQPGTFAVVVEAAAGDVRLQAGGEVVVDAAPRLWAVGPGGSVLAAALRAQGFTVEVSDSLPALEDGVDAVVASGLLSADDQERLLSFVDAGGGAFLVGRPDGGALPIVGEAAADLSPVVLSARPRLAGEHAAGRDAAPPAPPPVPPPAPPPAVPPQSRPDEAARGDTSGARPPAGPEQTVDRRTVAMVFLLDRSESMLAEAAPTGATRMDYVRSSAQATASKLLPGDELAVVTFGNRDAEEVLLPLTPVTAFERVHRALGALEARRREGTYVESALARAQALLASSPAAIKHVVVITDGQIEDLLRAVGSAKGVRDGGGTVSMIRFGADGEGARYTDLCRQFVAAGGGGYLHSTTTTEVPALVSSEVKRVLSAGGRSVADDAAAPESLSPAAAAEQPAAPSLPPPEAPQPTPPDPAPAQTRLAVRVLEASPLLTPLASSPSSPPPPVGGVLAVSARPEARVLLVAGDDGRPLLAFKNYGLGRVAAWTADLAGAWSSEWRAAAAFPAWLGQWVAALTPPSVRAAAADVLRARRVQPRGPTPTEVAALQAYTGQPVLGWRQLPASSPALQRTRQSLSDMLALAAAAAILVLAALEFALARRRAATATS